nr:MAG TPA: General transcriptional corepressor TUP1 helix bundle, TRANSCRIPTION [Caudoviricetes sp.]
MSSAEELREDLKEFKRNFEKLSEEINDIFSKYIDFSYKAKQQLNEMQKRLNRLEELERKRKK